MVCPSDEQLNVPVLEGLALKAKSSTGNIPVAVHNAENQTQKDDSYIPSLLKDKPTTTALVDNSQLHCTIPASTRRRSRVDLSSIPAATSEKKGDHSTAKSVTTHTKSIAAEVIPDNEPLSKNLNLEM